MVIFIFDLCLQPAATSSTASASASSPPRPPWSPRSLSGRWSGCWPPRRPSSTCRPASCSAWALGCGRSTPRPGTTSSDTVRAVSACQRLMALTCKFSVYPLVYSGGEDPEGLPAAGVVPERRTGGQGSLFGGPGPADGERTAVAGPDQSQHHRADGRRGRHGVCDFVSVYL